MALIEAEAALFEDDDDDNLDVNVSFSSEGENEDQEENIQETVDVDAEKPTSKQEAAKVIKPKRVVKNPQPKLDAQRLCGPRGIGIVQKWLANAPYRGKNYETEDLGLLIKRLQHWAHRLYPKLPFNDTIKQIEKLGHKKEVQVNIKRMRLDLYEAPSEDQDGVVHDDDDVADDANQLDAFDELLKQTGGSIFDGVRGETDGELGDVARTVSSETVVLTDEQKARIERNRRLALAKRQFISEASGSSSSDPKVTSVTGNSNSFNDTDRNNLQSFNIEEENVQENHDVSQSSSVESGVLTNISSAVENNVKETELFGQIGLQPSVVIEKRKLDDVDWPDDLDDDLMKADDIVNSLALETSKSDITKTH